MNKVSLSIAIPMYNHEKTIRATLDSIFCQLKDIKDICDLEVVIADNCSTDKSPEIIKNEYLTKYSSVLKYHKNEINIGVLKNIIQLPKLVSKKYTWFFGDDFIKQDGIKTVCNAILSAKNKNFGAIILQAESSHNISEKPMIIHHRTHNDNKVYEFDNIEDMSTYSKNNNCCSVLTPSFISILILDTHLSLKRFNLINVDNLYPHLYLFFHISMVNKILFINNALVVAQSPNSNRGDGDFNVQVAYDRVVVIDEIFGNINLLSNSDIQAVKKHMAENIVYHFYNIKYRKKIVEIALKYNIFGNKNKQYLFNKYYNLYFYLLFIKNCNTMSALKTILKKIGLFNFIKKCKQKFT